MIETNVPVVSRPAHSVDSLQGKGNVWSAEKLSLDVAALLDVLARIEVRRQAKLRGEQPGEVK